MFCAHGTRHSLFFLLLLLLLLLLLFSFNNSSHLLSRSHIGIWNDSLPLLSSSVFFFKLFYFFTFIYFSWEKKKDRKRTNMSRDVSDLSSFPRKSYCCHAVASDLSRLTLVAFAFQSSPCLVSLSLHLALRASPCLALFRFQVVELHAIAPILSPSFQLPKFCAAAVNRLCFILYWIFRIRVCLSSPLFYRCVVACCYLVTKIVSES